MTNHLAAELRGILDDLGDDPHNGAAIERIRRLAEHVDQVADYPFGADASTELTASFGLEPEQEIRDRGLERAIAMLHGSDLAAMAEAGVLWKLADQAAAYIRTGERAA